MSTTKRILMVPSIMLVVFSIATTAHAEVTITEFSQKDSDSLVVKGTSDATYVKIRFTRPDGSTVGDFLAEVNDGKFTGGLTQTGGLDEGTWKVEVWVHDDPSDNDSRQLLVEDPDSGTGGGTGEM